MSICNILRNNSYIDINTIDTSNFTEEDYKRVVLNDIHVIDFNNSVPETPFFFEKLKQKDNRLWAGDVDCPEIYFNKIYLDTEKMKEYNIFYFYIDEHNKSYNFKNVYNNLIKINQINGKFNYLLCLIDIKKNGQLFSSFFSSFFIRYYVGIHNVELNINLVEKILKKDGIYIINNNNLLKSYIGLNFIDIIINEINEIYNRINIKKISINEKKTLSFLYLKNGKQPAQQINNNIPNQNEKIPSIINKIIDLIKNFIKQKNNRIQIINYYIVSTKKNKVIQLIYLFKIYRLILFSKLNEHSLKLFINISNFEGCSFNNIYYYFQKT